MELLCPNCQKKLTVPEQYAGQLMRCPLCQGTFTVPAMPSTVAAESAEPVGFYAPPTRSDTAAVPAELAAIGSPSLPPISAEAPAAPVSATSAPPSTPSAGYARVCAMRFNPHVIQWLPLGLVLSFLLTFFPWFSGDAVIATLSTSSNVWNIGFGESKHGLIIFFDLLIIFAALFAIASLLFSLKVILDVPALQPFLPLRSLIVGAIAVAAWFFLTVQWLVWLFGLGLVPLNFWGWVAWVVTTIATIGPFLELWLERRGSVKPWPRMSMEW